jgi:DNA-directed RNA polymerase
MNASANPQDPSLLAQLLFGNREKQLRLEKEMLDASRFVLDERELLAKDRQAEVNTVGGRALYLQTCREVRRIIQEELDAKTTGRPKKWVGLLRSLPHETPAHISTAAACLTMHTLLNSLSRRRSFQDVAIAIGTDLMFSFLPDASETPLGTQDVLPHDPQLHSWSEKEKCEVGSALIDIAVRATCLFHIEEEEQRNAKRKPLRVIAATDACYERLLEHKEFYTYAHPQHWPMVCPPEQWSPTHSGGYLDERLQRRHPLVRLHTRHQRQAYPIESLGNACEAVNLVQSSGYRINRWLLDQINTAIARRLTIDGLPPIDVDDYSPAPSETMDRQTLLKAQQVKHRELLRSYRKAAKMHLGDFPSDSIAGELSEAQLRRARAKWAREKRGIVSGLVHRRLVLEQAERFKDEPRLFLPCYLDFRGRLYYTPLLQPGQATLGKALLEAASGKAIENEEQARWLAIHVANTYGCDGLDKKPYKERYGWALANEEQILMVASDPFQDEATMSWWTLADSPLEFLAACNEYRRFKQSGFGYDSHLIVYMDGTCNGLQHLAAMTGDEAGGREVNLVPDDVPRDIYAQAWQKCEQTLEDFAANGTDYEKDLATRWQKVGANRRFVKPVVMCLPYGLTISGAIEQLEEELDQRQSDGNGTPFDDLSRKERRAAIRWFYQRVLKDAIADVTSVAKGTMRCLRSMANVVGSAGKEIEWRTPDGFCVKGGYYKDKEDRVDITLFDHGSGRRKRHTAAIRVPTNELNANKQKSGFVPNFVHSMDATAMRLYVRRAAEQGVSMFAMVHDSFGCHAADVPIMHRCIRESFATLYRDGTVLSTLRSDLVASLPAAQAKSMSKVLVPPYGSLNIDGVLDSPYFFM